MHQSFPQTSPRSQSRNPHIVLGCIIVMMLLLLAAGSAKAQSIAVSATRLGPVNAGRTADAQSFLRLFNSSARAETITVQILSTDNTRVLATCPTMAQNLSRLQFKNGWLRSA